MQVAGSSLVLAAFVLSQLRFLKPESRLFLGLNALGSTILGIDAAVEHQWGFLILEGVWAMVSVVGLVRAVREDHPSDRSCNQLR
ncbi:CBU_0592 family membrane protein [Leifsonia sp. AG29]|uniref:CBU_0592 family membrane protein n=1 Tax=Leifsonia sp. AG29 TaxID=2598860 RepID=UPI003FA3BE11